MSLNEEKEIEKGTEQETETTQEIDWKAEAEKLRDVTQKQKGALREERKRRKELEASIGGEEAEDESSDVETIVEKKLNRIEQSRIEDEIDTLLEELVDNPDKRKVVRHIYENKLNPSGYTRTKIREDLRTALLIADPRSVEAIAEKKARKDLATKQVLQSVGQSTRSSVDSSSVASKKLSAKAKRMYRAFGIEA